jgi:hypothetical protein
MTSDEVMTAPQGCVRSGSSNTDASEVRPEGHPSMASGENAAMSETIAERFSGVSW